PLDALEPEAPTWLGERAAWLRDLNRRLAEDRCAVGIASPTSSHDVEVSVGPLVSCRLTTAVVWSWSPIARVRYRIRPLSVACALAVIALAEVGDIAPAVLGSVGLVVVAVGEWLVL